MSILIENIEVFFGIKENEDFKITKVNLENSAQKSIKETIDIANNIIKDKDAIDINEVDKADDEMLLKVSLEEVPWCIHQIELIFQNKYDIYNLQNLIENEDDIKFYIVACVINNEEYYFYKRATLNKLLAPKKRFLVFEENYLEAIESKNIITFDDYYDFFIKNEYIYLLKENQFSLLTGYYKKEKEKCDNILSDIEKLGIVSNMEELKAFCCERISYIKKISKIDKESIKEISFDRIKDLRDRDNIDILIDDSRNQIAFTNNIQLKNTVDILLDNFLVSRLTGTKYRGINKKKE